MGMEISVKNEETNTFRAAPHAHETRQSRSFKRVLTASENGADAAHFAAVAEDQGRGLQAPRRPSTTEHRAWVGFTGRCWRLSSRTRFLAARPASPLTKATSAPTSLDVIETERDET